MAGESAFQVEGVVVEALANKTYRVELANGHRFTAFVAGKAKQSFGAARGDRVRVQLSPYDLSEGRILTRQCNGQGASQNEAAATVREREI